MPPLLLPQDCPPISIVTLSYNRPKFIENACLNVLHSDYPRDKIEWIVVDDSDPTESASNRIVQFGERYSPGSVVYIPLTKKRSIGYKRNLGVERAKHSIILMMDDDDHYPDTSVAERMRWLLRSPGVSAVGCSTIPMYDITRYISAMNVPPLKLRPTERVSEATVAFHIPDGGVGLFSDKDIAEGDGLIGTQYREIPPMGIIVSFIHSANTSSRRVPAETEANGCHYGFGDEYFRYLHTIGGV